MLLPLLLVLFFGSGLCALIYQVMWLRLLALVFGVTVYAASTVLASFMGGLALGSYSAGRFAGRLRSPLRAFGIVEIGVGLSALVTPLLLEGVKHVWVALQPSLPSSLLFVTAARFIAAFAVLIVPTTLMGATLPIVMRSALVRDRAVGSRIGLLYAINTTGAIVGALIAGFYFISEIGVTRSFLIAAGVNVVIGFIAVAASYRIPTSAPALADNRSNTPDATSTPVIHTGARNAVLWTFLLSGILSLALEIVWFRMLVTLLRPTAYAFTIMLAAVLAGIALGSAVAAPVLRRSGPWLAVLTVVQLAISIAAVLSFNTLTRAQDAATWLAPMMTSLGFDPYVVPIVASSLIAMLPTTLLLGFAFPVGLALWTGGSGDAARRIGVFYALNVFGAIIGSIVAGFVMLPTLGSRGSLIATAALALISSVMLAWQQRRLQPNFAGVVGIAGPVTFIMASMNAVNPHAVAADRLHRGERMMWREEGVQTTVAIHERGDSARPMRVMYLDGMHQANDSAATAFVHHRIGALPVILHPSPRHALVVGLGGGATPGAVARFPGLQVDVVELSSAVVDGSEFFRHINFDLLRRPNVRLMVDDGRNYLLTTRQRYDVITADIILPRHAGAGALYSREYFELVRNALADGGLALQWNGSETETQYKLIMRTFLEVFPYTTLWGDGTLMLGSTRPFELSRSGYEHRQRTAGAGGFFNWTFEVLSRQYVAGPNEMRAWVGDGPILTDDKPRIEYFLSLPKDDPPVDVRGLRGNVQDILRP